MTNKTISVPDELAKEVKKRGFSWSNLAQIGAKYMISGEKVLLSQTISAQQKELEILKNELISTQKRLVLLQNSKIGVQK